MYSSPNPNGHMIQPPPQFQARGPPVPWSAGLCGCFSDMKNCCITLWCPWITFGQIAEIVDQGSTSCMVSGALYAMIAFLTGCACCYSCFYRTKMRQQYNLAGNSCWDCWVHCRCEHLALCQEYRQLQALGFDVPLGWHGNIERRNRQLAPVVQGMSRHK